MPKYVYTLKKRKDTEELHLFEGEMLTDRKNCSSNKLSVCEKMNKTESAGNIFTCYDENAARIKCAETGRSVCGICVSHLYATYSL